MKEILIDELEKYCEKVDLLLVTATKIETEVLLNQFLNFPEEEELRIFHHHDTYTLGVFGSYGAVHVQCNSMGSASRQGSALTILDAIDKWKPKAVIMPGIAFGRDEKKQKLAQILVSEAIIPYEFARIGAFQTISRAVTAVAGSTLFERAKVAGRGRDDVHYGKILSGEKLVDNSAYKHSLFNEHIEAIGGEMEGAGLFAACSRRNISEWILVKGICDWGDGNKAKDFQKEAAEAAVNFVKNLFMSKTAFENLGLTPLILANNKKVIIENQVLEVNTFLAEIENLIWPNNPKARSHVGSLVREICDNAFKHGKATRCQLECKNSMLIISYDGKEFNLLNSKSAGGGRNTLDYILQNHFNSVEYLYEYSEGKNYVHLMDVSGTMMDFTISNMCSVVLTDGHYNSSGRKRFFQKPIEVPSSCDEVILDLTERSNLFFMSGTNYMIKEVVERIDKSSKLRVLLEDESFIRHMFKDYKKDRVTIEFIKKHE